MTEGVATVSLFGKLAARADFVRVDAGDPVGQWVESWLVDAVEHSQGEVPAEPARFLAMVEGTPVLGVWVKSRDQVGRVFPLVAFARLDQELCELGWAVLPAFFDHHLAHLEKLLAERLLESPATLVAAVRAVEAPHPSELVRAVFDAETSVDSERIGTFGARVGAPMAYALFALREAQQREGVSPTLDCPIQQVLDSFVWLSLVRAAAPDSYPSLVWTKSPGRGLASSAQPSPLTLAFLREPSRAATTLWPVTSAIVDTQSALDKLQSRLRAVLLADESMGTLIRAVRSGR